MMFRLCLEPNIRAELVEQIPQIGVHLTKSQVLPNGVPHYLLPILEQFLTDTNSQVIDGVLQLFS